MKKVFNGKVYNTETLINLCSNDCYNNGNYSGQNYIGQTPKGLYCFVSTSNGQDFYRQNNITPINKQDIQEYIEGWELSDEEIKKLKELGIIIEA
jgi:hypothetical protein